MMIVGTWGLPPSVLPDIPPSRGEISKKLYLCSTLKL